MTRDSQRVPYSDTSVPPERSQTMIQRLLYEHGAEATQWTEVGDAVELKFVMRIDGKPTTIRVRPATLIVRKRSQGRSGSVQTMVSKAATMRLLYWWLKAQLEAVRFGLISMQEAFLADIAGHLPDGREVTVLELVGDRLDAFDPAELARELPEPKEQSS